MKTKFIKLKCGCTKRKFRSHVCIKKKCECKKHWHGGAKMTVEGLQQAFHNVVKDKNLSQAKRRENAIIAKMMKKEKYRRTNKDRVQDATMFIGALGVITFIMYNVGQAILVMGK